MAEEKLTIAVLGAGNIGRTLGKKWSTAGHKVSFSVSDPTGQNAQTLRAETANQLLIGTIADVLQTHPDLVLVALPGGAVEAVAQQYGAQLNESIIIDAANRIGEDSMHNLAHFQNHAPQAQVFRAFNSLGWENFADPEFDGVQADLFYCGPDGTARAKVEQLISDIGLRPVYLGGIDQVGLLDSLTSLWFTLAFAQKKGRHIAFKVLGI